MDLKAIQAKLKVLRDRIRDQGSISSSDEKELQSLINQTLTRANSELEDIQSRLENITRKANDNRMLKDLDDDQKSRLSMAEKSIDQMNKSVH